MDERRISKAEFKEAQEKVMKDMMNDPDLDGMAKLLIPMTGVTFATKMAAILFPKEDSDVKF